MMCRFIRPGHTDGTHDRQSCCLWTLEPTPLSPVSARCLKPPNRRVGRRLTMLCKSRGVMTKGAVELPPQVAGYQLCRSLRRCSVTSWQSVQSCAGSESHGQLHLFEIHGKPLMKPLFFRATVISSIERRMRYGAADRVTRERADPGCVGGGPRRRDRRTQEALGVEQNGRDRYLTGCCW